MNNLLVMKTGANILPGGIRGRYFFFLFKVNLVTDSDFTHTGYYKIIQQTCWEY